MTIFDHGYGQPDIWPILVSIATENMKYFQEKSHLHSTPGAPEYEDDGGESAFRQCNDTGTAQNLESQEEEAREGSAISVQKLEVLDRGPAAASRHSSQESVKRQLKKERKKGKGGNKGKTRHNQSKLVVKGKRMHKDKINVKDCW